MLVDTHTHLNFAAFKDDVDDVIKRALESDVWIINVGSQYTTSKKAVEIAENYEKGIYAAIGLHPIHLETGLVKVRIDPEEIDIETKEEDFDTSKYKSMAMSSDKVVAIGEIGLDYYYKPKTKRKLELFKEKQKEAFKEQLRLAEELNLPVIFHCRVAHEDLIDTLNQQLTINNKQFNGVIHCFTGTLEQAQQYLEMGFYLGFNGLIFKLNFDEIIKKAPIEKILIETDCPYLTPPIGVNQRLNQRKSAVIRNEPLCVKYIAEKIAQIKNIDFDKIAETTTQNAQKLFKI